MIKNPIKFVKLFNIRSGSEQIVPLSTYERLSQESPKTMRNIDFLYNCDEEGNRIESPKIEVLKPVIESVLNAGEKAKTKKDIANKTE